MKKAALVLTAMVLMTGCGAKPNALETVPNAPALIMDGVQARTKPLEITSLEIPHETLEKISNENEECQDTPQTHQNGDTDVFYAKVSILSTNREEARKEAYMLSRLAMAEAEGESLEGKAWVIMVVLNRVESPDFPDTVEEVIFQPDQFSSVWDGRYEAVEPNEDCRLALEMVFEGWDKSRGALYFEAVSNGSDTWHSRNLQYIETVGNHNFYR